MTRHFYLYEDDGGDRLYFVDCYGNTSSFSDEAEIFTEATCPDFSCLDNIHREYLPEDQQNKLNGHPALFVINGDKMMPATLDQKVKQILANIDAARERLQEVNDQIYFVNSVGRYPAKARESWQKKANSPYKYLYMVFRSDGDGGHQGPDGKRKVYVGSETDEAAIYDARRLNSNYMTWTKLKAVERQIANWILGREHEVRELERLADNALERSAKLPTIPDDIYIHTPKKLPDLEKSA